MATIQLKMVKVQKGNKTKKDVQPQEQVNMTFRHFIIIFFGAWHLDIESQTWQSLQGWLEQEFLTFKVDI